MLGKTPSAEPLASLGKISGLIGVVAPFFAVDDGLPAAYTAELGVELRDVRVGDATFFTLPSTGTGNSPDGLSVVVIDEDGLATVQRCSRPTLTTPMNPSCRLSTDLSRLTGGG